MYLLFIDDALILRQFVHMFSTIIKRKFVEYLVF